MKCYLLTVPRRYKQAAKNRMARLSCVARITDHGGHIKVIASKQPPRQKHCGPWVEAEDETTHWDVKYWDFAMAVYRRSLKRGQAPAESMGVMVHYLCNLFGLPEQALLSKLFYDRAFVDAWLTNEEAHGWELDALGRAQ